MDWTPVPFTEVPTCVGCLVAKGVLDLVRTSRVLLNSDPPVSSSQALNLELCDRQG